MKKLLIVSNDLVGETLKVVLSSHFDEIILSDRKNALEAFLLEEPSHVFISDMIHSKEDAEVFKDFQGANVNSRIIRYGFEESADIQLPALISDILKKLFAE